MTEAQAATGNDEVGNDSHEWQHVVWMMKASSRAKTGDGKVGVDVDKASDWRQKPVPFLKIGSLESEFYAELEEYSPVNACRVASGETKGIPLEFHTTTWNDRGTVSKAKCQLFLLTKMGEQEKRWTDAMAKGLESALAEVEIHLNSGLSRSALDCSAKEASESDKVFKAYAKAANAKYREKIMAPRA